MQDALRQVEAAEKSAQTANRALEQSSGQAAMALTAESQAARQSSQATQTMEQAAQAAAQAMGQTLATAVSQAAQAMIQAQREAKKAEEEIRKAEKAAEEAARPFGEMGTKLLEFGRQALAFGAAQVGIATLRDAFNTVKEAATGAVQAAIKMESLQATFKAISGSSQAAEKDLSFLRSTADRLGIGFTELAKGYQLMAAAAQHTSVAGQQVQDIFTAIAEKGRVLGLSAQEIQGAMLAVSQSFSKGVVQAEELRGQFGERMPGALTEVSRALGITTADLDKMMQAGQLGIDMWPKWAGVVRTDLAGATAEASKTAGAALERLVNDMQRFQAAIGQFFLPGVASAINALHQLASTALTAMDAMGKTVEAQKQFQAAQQAAAGPGGAERSAEFTRIQERIRLLQQEQEMLKAGQPIIPSGTEAELNTMIARRTELLKEQQAITKNLLGDEERRRDAARSIQMTTIQQRDTFLESGRKLLEQQRKEQEAMTQATRAGLGRDPTADEKRSLLEDQLKKAQEFLQTNSALAAQYKDDPVVKALRQRGQATEAFGKQLDDADEADKQAKRDAAAAAREEEKARKEALERTFATGKEVLKGYEEEGALVAELQSRYEQLKYTEEERLALKIAAVKDDTLRQELEDQLALIEAEKARNDQLRERNKLLQDQAQASKATWDDIQRLQKQLEPQRRTMSREEQLQQTREELARRSGNDPGTMARADEQIARTLNTERWQKVYDGLNRMADELTQTFVDMASTGEFSFKRLADSFTRTALQMVADALDIKGALSGWLKGALGQPGSGGQGGSGLLGALGGLFGNTASAGGGTGMGFNAAGVATSGTLPTTWGQYAQMSAAGAFGGGMQLGGPVYSDRAYLVGERGPELFVPQRAGTIVPHGAGGGGRPVVVNMTVVTTDANSFRASPNQIKAQMVVAAQQARRVL